MKKVLYLFILIALSASTTAQSPRAFKYQAIVRDNSGNVLGNKHVSFKMSIRLESASGLPVYVETFDTLTNQAGLVNINIGSGIVESGDLTAVRWKSGKYYLQVEIDTTGGSDYQPVGTTQLISQPYAMYADLTGGLVLTDENGHQYQLGVDTLGNLVTTSLPDFECGDIIIDERDGQQYPTIAIGTQCWMAKNLNNGVFTNTIYNHTNNGIIQKYCHSNNTANCDVYGGLYQWNEMMNYETTPGSVGICPPSGGWHIPTDAEWCIMEQFIDPTIICNSTGERGVDGGGKLKETGTLHWMSPNNGATNSTGFTALPGGFRTSGSGGSKNIHKYGYFWSSDLNGSYYGWVRSLYYYRAKVSRWGGLKVNGYSVRCVK